MSEIIRTKKVSIIIPCYNVDCYIRECVDSVFNQTSSTDNIEVIAIDDKSTDGTLEILFEYEENKPENIMLIPLENHIGMPGTVRNIALSYATGDFVVFLDADDVLEPDFLKSMFEIFDDDVDVVSCGYTLFDENGEIEIDLLDDASYDLDKVADRKAYICAEGTRTSVWARMYRRQFLKECNINFANEYHIAEDMFFWHHCLFDAAKAKSTSKCLYRYRVKNDSLFHSRGTNYAMDIVNCACDCSKDFNDKNWSSECADEYSAVVFTKCGFELLGYLDSHDTTDDLFTEVIATLRNMLRNYWPSIVTNRYLDGSSKELAGKLLR